MMTFHSFVKLVIQDGEAFWHIEDLDLTLRELKNLCSKQINNLSKNIPGAYSYQRKYLLDSLENWYSNMKYLEMLNKFWQNDVVKSLKKKGRE